MFLCEWWWLYLCETINQHIFSIHVPLWRTVPCSMPFDLNTQLQGKPGRNTEFLVYVLVFCLRVRHENQYHFYLTASRDSKDWKLVAAAGFTESKMCNRLTWPKKKKRFLRYIKKCSRAYYHYKALACQELNIQRSPLIQLRLADLWPSDITNPSEPQSSYTHGRWDHTGL